MAAGAGQVMHLFLSILPRVLVAMMRPVQLVQAPTVATEHG